MLTQLQASGEDRFPLEQDVLILEINITGTGSETVCIISAAYEINISNSNQLKDIVLFYRSRQVTLS